MHNKSKNITNLTGDNMIVYETKFHQLLVNKSHDDCNEYVCQCNGKKSWRFWIKNKKSPINSAWKEFPSEAEAMAKALEYQPEVIKFEIFHQQENV